MKTSLFYIFSLLIFCWLFPDAGCTTLSFTLAFIFINAVLCLVNGDVTVRLTILSSQD